MNTNDLNQDNLIAAFKNGDPYATDQIYTVHYKALCYFARSLINSKEEAEDIVVESFIKLINKRNDFDSVNEIKGFLYKATKNHCLDHLKHIKRKTASHQEIIYLMEKDEDYIQSRVIRAELLRMILEEVEHLPSIRKQIFKLIFVDGLNTNEIADKLHITVDTVRVQKARALQSLRNVFLKNELLSLAFICVITHLSL